jgi:hypothetical protein
MGSISFGVSSVAWKIGVRKQPDWCPCSKQSRSYRSAFSAVREILQQTRGDRWPTSIFHAQLLPSRRWIRPFTTDQFTFRRVGGKIIDCEPQPSGRRGLLPLKHGMTIEKGASIISSFRAQSRNPVALPYVSAAGIFDSACFAQDDTAASARRSLVNLHDKLAFGST